MSRSSRSRRNREYEDGEEERMEILVGVTQENDDNELIYDPDQDRDEKRALRQNYRKLQDNELLQDPNAIKSEALTQMVQTADTLFAKVKGPQEATLDSSFLVTAATLGNAKARSMRSGAGGLDIDELVARFFTLMGGHRPGDERMTEDDESVVDPDVEGVRPLDWAAIGRRALAKSRRVPAQDFMLGPLMVEAKKRTVGKRTQREKADAVEKRPIEIKEDDIEQSGNETTKNVAALERLLGEAGEINLFRLIINPQSFGQSVENLFHLSFLIRDGKVQLYYSEANEPLILLVEPPTDEDYREGLRKHQMILELDIATWKKAIEVFDIQESFIPTRKPAKMKLGNKWYG